MIRIREIALPPAHHENQLLYEAAKLLKENHLGVEEGLAARAFRPEAVTAIERGLQKLFRDGDVTEGEARAEDGLEILAVKSQGSDGFLDRGEDGFVQDVIERSDDPDEGLTPNREEKGDLIRAGEEDLVPDARHDSFRSRIGIDGISLAMGDDFKGIKRLDHGVHGGHPFLEKSPRERGRFRYFEM